MLPEIAHFSLIIGFCFSLFIFVLPLINRTLKQKAIVVSMQTLVLGQFAFIFLAFLLLNISFINNDFSLIYVANNSSVSLPCWYKCCASWGAHEGSMLLWSTLLSLFMFIFSRQEQQDTSQFYDVSVAILAWINIGFLLFILTTSNPFIRIFSKIPTNGSDLNPLLQDIGFLFHPPILYTGYVGFAVVFAISLVSLLLKKTDKSILQLMRSWVLFAWCFLTLGIVLGSWWAYRELGWGGYWFWDPVENASIMPWLSATALIHSLSITIKRKIYYAWTQLLALLTFCLSLLGTFLVRSGILTSVHAFALSPGRGLYMLAFLLVVIGAALLVYAFNAPRESNSHSLDFLSKGAFLLLNNVFFVVMLLTVLLGTLYPLMIDALGWGKLSVGSPYFNMMAKIFLTPLLLLLAILPALDWKGVSLLTVKQRIRLPIALAIGLALGVTCYCFNDFDIKALLGLTLAFWLIIQTLVGLFKQYRISKAILSRSVIAMTLAHLGIAIITIGVVCEAQYSVVKDSRFAIGTKATLGPYQLQLISIKRLDESNFNAITGVFVVSQKGQEVTRIHSQKRVFNRTQIALSSAGIDAGLFRDIYIALGEPLGGGAWSVRLYYKPMIRFIWGGGLMLVLGGLLAIGTKRKSQAVGIDL